jgi:hypothetical protein
MDNVVHEISINTHDFVCVGIGSKKFCVVLDDATFKEFDYAFFYELDTQKENKKTGRTLMTRIGEIRTFDNTQGIESGYCVMSIEVLK